VRRLSRAQVERFIDDGFVKLESVVPPEHLMAGRALLWADLGMDPDEPSTWTAPVTRVLPSVARPFKAAFDQPLLHAAFDQLVGPGRWLPRPDLGIFVVRFPHAAPPGDTGWHIDASFAPAGLAGRPGADTDFGDWRVSVSSRGRALLMLFLFSDVGPNDGPTRLRMGSHLDVPTLLLEAGEAGLPAAQVSPLADQASSARPVVVASGRAGDVYLCHPFLVHAAQAPQGSVPRLMAQPGLANTRPFAIEKVAAVLAPVEVAVRRGLGLAS
jgi:Phytanoyl-CoA dioxygenase (PhyH)